MGGRGASSGTSQKGRTYGSEYKSILQVGNIKFIEATNMKLEQPLETMTRGRVYVLVSDKKISSVIYYGNNLKRVKQIDLLHKHKGVQPHAHHGYYHSENDTKKGATRLTTKERDMVDKVSSIWENYINNT